ncbi:hypothetical protein WR164_01250 [Philodulcilactobacillus myokoensis]|uniref:DUF2255 family protein n=1 Tax=Philodulcilactobacillus myokoensis TaxID=2929573 RepID=A0A9W6EQP1_9LACO|nr:DUF2255 family protein [Philodulcilactobacillus myokoensis]GLB46146.1 hypothetical protein WR164_01250 [Philodulcilactobacillus myokoensis]
MAKEWTKEQLNGFAKADDMHISPFYSDGKTYGTPTWIWSVVADNHLYVRAFNGQNSRWHQSAMTQKAGKIHLNGQDYEVTFKDASGDKNLDAKINQAYQTKYAGSPYMPPMLEDGPVSATVEIDPR